MQRTLLVLLSLLPFAAANAQDAATQCAEALLRRDAAAAARAAATVTAPATRARLQAALLPLEQRPAAMLAVARAFAADAEADHALLAAAAAMMMLLDRGDVVPGLAAWTEEAEERDRYVDMAPLVPVFLGLRQAVDSRRAAGGDAARLREAERFLELATVSRFGLWPARLSADAPWERPAGLAEDLQLTARPCPRGHVDWNHIEARAAPAWQAVLLRTGELKLPPLPAGNWLLEVRSASTPWRGVRAIEVSDLDGIGLATEGVMVLAAFDRSGPVAARWQLCEGTLELANGQLGAAPSVVAWPEQREHGRRDRELCLQGAAGSAWIEMSVGDRSEPHRGHFVAHGMVDRPLYRPGETVQGRIVLRSYRFAGEGLGAVPSTSVAADQPLRVIVDLGSVGKLELPGRTDAHGVYPFSFVVPAEMPPGEWIPLEIELPERDAKGDPLRVDVGRLCATSFYRRPGVRLRVEGPEEVAEGTASAEITAIAEWASGGPAAGLDVSANVTVRVVGAREETVQLRTGDDGRAVVRVPLASLGATFVWADFSLTGPDGHVAHAKHRLQVMDAEARAEAAKEEKESPWYRHLEVELGSAVVGASCRVSMRGPADQHGILAVGRGANVRAQAIRFDSQGRSQADVPVLRLDWPRLDVTVATREHRDDATAPIALRATRAPEIELPPLAQPGSEVPIRISTDAAGTVVTVAVVDERIFALQPDRTPDPSDALRPEVPWWRWGHVWMPPRGSPAELIGSLLRHGRVPPMDGGRDLSRNGAAHGHAAAGTPAPGGLRDDFRATAAFVTLVADAGGVVNMNVRLPSDLTRWRVTVVGVDPEGTGSTAVRTLASRQPLAAEPLLPRALRAGDTFALPISVDRSAEAAATADLVKVTAAAEGEALQVTAAPADVAVAAGRVARTKAELRAVAAGSAKLLLGAGLGEHGDRSQREVRVDPDAVVRPLQAAALGTGEIALPMPEGTSPDAGLTADVLLGGAAAWRRIEESLTRYPHGCVEQTLSRLLPYFAAARVAKARGEPLPAMDAGFRRRLHGGLARLRMLQHFRFGFAFWPGGDVDPGMTALALHGLAQLREGGIDPEQADLRIDVSDYHDPLWRVRGGDAKVDASFVMAAEVVVGLARFAPDNENARAATAKLLELLPQLPAGLCARLGLVRHAAGDDAGARRCLERLGAAAAPPLAADGFPGEDPLAVQAMQLELATVLHADPAGTPARVADLLLACLRGHGSTYAHACALAALAQVLPPTPDVAATVEVRVGDATRTFAIGGKAGDVIHWRAPSTAAVTVRGPNDVPLLVRIATERSERASDHAAWQTPIQVTRELCISRLDATWSDRRDGTDLEVVKGPPLVGRTYSIRVRLQSPVPMRFVVVECPLPAGFELSGEASGVDRYDDRVVFTCDLVAGVPHVRAFPVVPTVTGRVLWPPVVAAPMYVAGLEGGTAGGMVEVVDAAPGAVPTTVTCFTKPAPPEEPDEVDPFDAFFKGLRDAWNREPVDEAQGRRDFEALLQTLPMVIADEQWRWLDELTDLVGDLDVEDVDIDAPAARWRPGAVARVQALLCETTSALLDRMPATGAEGPSERWWMLARAAERCAKGPARDAVLARLLARASSKEFKIGLIRDVGADVTDPVLLAELRSCLASADAAVRDAAFAALPPAEQGVLPPALVIHAQEGVFDTGVIRLLAGSEAGRAELGVRLGEVNFVKAQLERLDEELPTEMWREVPLPVFRSLSAAIAADGRDGQLAFAQVVRRVAAGTFASADLQQAMAAAVEPAWRAVLAAALRQRGVTAAPAAARTGDTLWPLWTRALALGTDDADAAQRVLDDLAAMSDSSELDVEPQLLSRFLMPPIVAVGTPRQLYAARTAMTEDGWRAAWDRLDTSARVALLGLFKRRIGNSFVPANESEAEAVWRFFQRSGDVESTAGTMAASATGIAVLRRHLADDDSTANRALREAFAKELGLDARTLQPAPGEEWQSLCKRASIVGLGHVWTPAERAMLDSARALRGVAPPVAR